MKAFVTAQLTAEGVKELEKHMNLTFGGWGSTGVKLQPAELIARAGDADILLVCYEHVTPEVIAAMKTLKLIGCTRGGVQASVDVAAATKAGIPVLYTPGRNAVAVADISLGLTLAVMRNIALTSHYIRIRDWEHATWDMDGNTAEKRYSGPELEDKTMGIVGFGEVGRKIAQRAIGFGMRVIASDPFFKPDPALPQVRNVDLETLMRESDVVSMACVLNEKTKGMISRAHIAMMKPSAYFVNVARAALVDEEALCDALRNGKIAGAGLDVLVEEPINPQSPFLDMKNVVITPHIGGASSDIMARQTKIMVSGLLAYLTGERPRNIFNPEVLAR
ncbi:MAG: hypothetical protein LIP28_06065 [Deltaproteobacteria bacterium]|nr:hypothetical protein [Deltaproteobacteria bacterium]